MKKITAPLLSFFLLLGLIIGVGGCKSFSSQQANKEEAPTNIPAFHAHGSDHSHDHGHTHDHTHTHSHGAVQTGESTFTTNGGITCDVVSTEKNEVSITEEGDQRIIRTNSIPDHPTGAFPNAGNPNRISAQDKTYAVPLHPQQTGQLVSVYTGAGFGQGTPAYEFGVAINGINIEPSAMEAFVNPRTGERNFEWTKEALSTSTTLGEDCNNAHVQPSGKYHYHGTPHGIVDKATGREMFLTGWAADGFPMYYKYGYADANDPGSEVIVLTSSYQLRKGKRPGDGISAPNGPYDGTYVRDFEYVEGAGALDEANGRFGVTPEFPEGTYYYVITDEFPSIPRYFVGTPSTSFKLPSGGAMAGSRPGRGGQGRPGMGQPGGQGMGQLGGPGMGPGGNQPGQQGRRGRPDAAQILRDLDSNGDQRISKNEARGPLVNDFSRVDRNGDGFLTRDELTPPR